MKTKRSGPVCNGSNAHPKFVSAAGIFGALVSLLWCAPGAWAQTGGGPTCCGPGLGPQSLEWLQLPSNATRLFPDPSGLNTNLTWIIANLPGYGNVLVIQDAPTNVAVVLTNADFGRAHASASFQNVPHAGGAFNFTETAPGLYGPYSWGITPGSIALAYGRQYVTNGMPAPLPRYHVSFYFLEGEPDYCRLVFSSVGLAQFTTNTVSVPMTFRSEYDLIYDPTNYPYGPSADTVLDGVYGPPLAGDVTGTVVSSGYGITGGGDDYNTGWALLQPTNYLLTAALPPGSGTDVFANPYPAPGTYPFITVGVDHQLSDVFSLTVGYLCCTNCPTNCLQVVCPSGKTVACGSKWSFDPPTATTCCTNVFILPDGLATNVLITPVGLTTNGTCPQFITQTWMISDACDDTNWCSQIVEVVGCCTNCLQVQCPSDKTVQCGTAWTFDTPTATTCCPSNIVTSTGQLTNVLITSTGFVTNGACPQQTITESWLIQDGCGDTTNCSQTVVVLGCCTNCLQVVCPTNKSVECGSAWSFDWPTVSSCCPSNFVNPAGPLTNVEITSTGIVTNGVCPKFITQAWLITDACGNSEICTQMVTVVDTTPPTITCDTNFLVVPLNRNCQFIIPAIQVTASDSCTPLCQLSYSQSPRAGTTNLSGMPVVVTVTVTDLCGNSNQCSVVVKALDETGPVVTCPRSMDVTNCLVPCVPVTAMDNCCQPSQLTITQSPPCGTPLAPGINSVTVTVTDCHNNSTTRLVHLVVTGPQSFLANLFNTGVDPGGTPLADNTVDPHYALPVTAVPGGMPADYAGSAVAVSDACHGGANGCDWQKTIACFVYTPWDLASPVSKWIAPDYADNGCCPAGGYLYSLNFVLPAGLNTATATISGRWAADNKATMYLNSVPVPAVAGGVTTNFAQWTPFTIPPGLGFVSGLNTLTLAVTNGLDFTGLRVEFTNAFANCDNCAPPVINWLTPSQTLPVGATATFSVTAGGTPPLTYQWYHNNAGLPGDVNSSMQVHSITGADAGLYSVVVSNACGVVTGYVRLNVIQIVRWTNAWWNVAQLARPLAATIGPDLNLVGSSPATDFALSAGSTEDLGLPQPGSQPVNVIRLNPQVGAALELPPIVPAGSNVDDAYTLIMDLYEPGTSFGTPSTLFQSVACCLGVGGQDGVALTLDSSNYLHIAGSASGTPFDAVADMPLPTDSWNRLALAVNNAADAGDSTLSAYINGLNVISIKPCTCCIIHPFGPSLSWSNNAPLVLSVPTNAVSPNAEFYLAGLQFHATAFSSQTLAGMGAPEDGSAPASSTEPGPEPVLAATLAQGTLSLTWPAGPYVLQETADLRSGNWMDSLLPFTTSQGTGGMLTTATTHPPNPNAPVKFYRLVFRP